MKRKEKILVSLRGIKKQKTKMKPSNITKTKGYPTISGREDLQTGPLKIIQKLPQSNLLK